MVAPSILPMRFAPSFASGLPAAAAGFAASAGFAAAAGAAGAVVAAGAAGAAVAAGAAGFAASVGFAAGAAGAQAANRLTPAVPMLRRKKPRRDSPLKIPMSPTLPVAKPTAALAASVSNAPGRASPVCPNDVAQVSAHVKRFA